jgi:hypothetical protein
VEATPTTTPTPTPTTIRDHPSIERGLQRDIDG